LLAAASRCDRKLNDALTGSRSRSAAAATAQSNTAGTVLLDSIRSRANTRCASATDSSDCSRSPEADRGCPAAVRLTSTDETAATAPVQTPAGSQPRKDVTAGTC
jgi:hypothetical protein